MKLILNKIHIENFKGCRCVEIDFSENLTRVFGANGCGKTTIADAFSWCLWNKDSHGNAPGTDAFRDKPVDEEGKEIHNLDTVVRLDCTLEGKAFNLKRVQRENWVKKRGYKEAIYQGNSSEYFINDVETKLSDFKARISEISDEERFRLIASLSAFNELEWKKRREQLVQLSDVDVDAELLMRDEYRQLADECAQRNIDIDGLKKVLGEQRKKANDTLKMIPVRIDEAKKALPTLSDRAIRDAEYLVEDSLKDIEHIRGYIDDERAKGSTVGMRARILSLEQELVSAKRRVIDEHNSRRTVIKLENDAASAAYRVAYSGLADARRALQTSEAKARSLIARRDELRDKYIQVRDENVDIETVCPFCGQELSSDSIATAKTKVAEKKRAALAEIKKDGKAVAEEIAAVEGELSKNREAEKAAEDRAKKATEERDAAINKMDSFQSEPDFDSEPRISEIEVELEEAKRAERESPAEKIKQLNERKAELEAIVEENRKVLALRDAGIEIQKRIKQLEEEQRQTGIQVGDVETLLMLCDKFVRDRCGALEDSINTKFPTVRWKLFDYQINGAIIDCCACMIPCDSGLVSYDSANTAAQICADIEIVKTLSDHYDVHLPLFIDNAESVLNIPNAGTQTIALQVAPCEMTVKMMTTH